MAVNPESGTHRLRYGDTTCDYILKRLTVLCPATLDPGCRAFYFGVFYFGDFFWRNKNGVEAQRSSTPPTDCKNDRNTEIQKPTKNGSTGAIAKLIDRGFLSFFGIRHGADFKLMGAGLEQRTDLIEHIIRLALANGLSLWEELWIV